MSPRPTRPGSSCVIEMSDPFQRTVLAPHRSPSWVTSTETVPDLSAAWALTVTACSIAAAGDTAGDPVGDPTERTVTTTAAVSAAAAGIQITGPGRCDPGA